MTKVSDAEWLEEAARYFENRDTGGEDMAFWANVSNAERCRSIAQSLRASIPGGVGVRVKALDWGERRAIHEVNWAWDAKTSIDWYVVATASGEGCKGTFYWFVVGYAVKGWANSEEEAKAAAQADYERRILSALDQLHKEGEQG